MTSPLRTRARWIGVALVVVLALAIASAALALTYGNGSDITGDPVVQAVAPEAPDRVLVVGDSLLHQARVAFDERFEQLDVDAEWIGGPGEGLLTDQREWLEQIDEVVGTFAPDAVVIEACCNYAQHDDEELFRLPDGTPVGRDTELMYELWHEAALEAVDRAGAGGAEVYVVVAPRPVEGTFFDAIVGDRMERIATIWRQVAEQRPEIHLVDWTPLFASEGRMVTVLPGVGRVRHEDGLHIVGPGEELVVDRTVTALLGTSRAG